MKISNINSNSYIYSSKRNSPSFGSLTKMFEKQIFAMPYQKAQRVVDSYDKSSIYIGYFPKDILEILKQNTESKKILDKKIKLFNHSLSTIAIKIKEIEKDIFQQVDCINVEDFSYRAIITSSQKLENSSVGLVKYPIKLFLSGKELEEIANNTNFEKTMKYIGVVPDKGSAFFTFVGKGTFKNCFKVTFLDKEGRKFIHPKAFVIGKNPDFGWDCNRLLTKNLSNYLNETGFEKFYKIMTEKINSDSTLSEEIKQKAINEIKPFFDTKYKTARIYDGATVFHEFYDINGIFPEANAALKIRKDLGKNISNSNMIQPYIYDLKNSYGLLEFADFELPTTKIKYDLIRYGLCWTDEKKENYSMGSSHNRKIIDYGCIFPKSKIDYYSD